ncbi:MAG TPA: DNA repair protein RadC [Opitutaceae bacterium]|nr:DNA repair protein RadC [Opitutaceae bacterium]
MNDESIYPSLRLKDLAVSDRPQERMARHGAGALSDAELLAIVLRTGRRGLSVLSIAQQLLAEAGHLAALARWTETDFRRQKGIGPAKAAQLCVLMELIKRVRTAEASTAETVFNRPALIHAHFVPLVAGLAVEKFWVLCLNRKNRLLKRVEVSSGTATSSLAHPREVFREAIRHGASGIVCVHNHPSGDPSPSAADVQVTRQLRDAARAVDIEFLDHLIVGRTGSDPRGLGYYSFREAGVI